MAEIIEGIYQLLTPFPEFSFDDAKALRRQLEEHPRVTKGLPYVLPYLIKSGGETALVDCGWNTDNAYKALETGMQEHGTHPTEIQKLFITHVHPDHYGMSGRLKQLSSCEVVLHEKDAEFIVARYFAPKPLADEMSVFMELNGVPTVSAPTMSMGSFGMLDKVSPVPPDTEVKGGETFKVGDFDFEIIWTPGHSPGHICLYEPNRKILMTGDHILPTITPNVSIHTQTHGSPLGDYMRSLEKLVDLDVKYVLPAHEFDIRDLKKRVIEIEEHHEVRLAEMLRCVDRGGSTAWEVAGRVKWATGMLTDFEPWMQRAAVGETLAHLEYMFELGQLSKVMRGKHLHWLPV
ncbi:MAG: MBL fold metallo-hydrolase [Dehalococcoidia bacterium]|nr:MBL fold metallo-hydrolase [Chloroflexi bacterium CFX7]NUQ54834.1 MBL fold metallo-hydrolase [Dehalococcoidia bacterium]RIL01487.1 MAG: MBL fold metallo-hydrolase [bacterium]